MLLRKENSTYSPKHYELLKVGRLCNPQMWYNIWGKTFNETFLNITST